MTFSPKKVEFGRKKIKKKIKKFYYFEIVFAFSKNFSKRLLHPW